MNHTTHKKEETLLDLLSQLTDYRRKQGQRHPLHILFLTTVMAIMAGAKSERAIARFAQNNRQSLIKELQIERKEIPSRDVLSAFVQHIDFNKLQDIFYTWTRQFVTIKKGEWLAIDGKAIRGTVTNASSEFQNFTSLITIFLSKKKQALLVDKINTKKENEIPKVKSMIEILGLQGVNFTLDALHCQTETVKTIIKTKNHYVIGVKENQKNLLKQVKKTVKMKKA